MATSIALARITNARDAGGVVLYDIAVQTDSGEVTFENVRGRGVVLSGGMVVGTLIGGGAGGFDFEPLRSVGAGGSAGQIRAIITRVTAIEGRDHEFEYACVRAGGPAAPHEWTPTDDETEITAYQVLEGIGPNEVLNSGISEADLDAASGFGLRALAIGARVILSRVDGGWYIQTVQAIGGQCEGA